MVGRAAAIFGVDSIIVFRDTPQKDQHRELDLIATVLSYMETPQYLRKRLFTLRPELKYAGVLPPLRTPHHPLENRAKDLADGEFREAATTAHTKDGTLADVGVEQLALIRNKRLSLNTRVTVRISKEKERLEAELADRDTVPKYWGYRVVSSDLTIGSLLKQRRFDLVIATSKRGRPFSEEEQNVLSRWKASRRILVAFGAPTRGLYEIAQPENLDLDNSADFVINMFPRQEVETVRTEEAVFVILGLLSMMTAKG
jgi:hypothetical protein